MPAGAATLAKVGGAAITDRDVIAAYGRLSAGAALRTDVDALVARRLVLKLARAKALAATDAEVSRAARLAAKARGPNKATNAATFRAYLAEEITIAKYIDLYIYPRIKADEPALREYFYGHVSLFVARPPAGRAAAAALFPRYRNEVLYRYVRSEIGRLLAEEAARIRKDAHVRIFVPAG